MTDPAQEISLKEFIERVFACEMEAIRADIDTKFGHIKETTIEARRIMETLMAGFPGQFAKKAELDSAVNTIKELKERDIKEIKTELDDRLSRKEYGFQHKTLVDKFECQEKRIQSVELLKAEITGKIWTLGIVVTFVVVAVQFALRYGK
jgi:hypothetical protein